MTSWAQRARAHFLQEERLISTIETIETPLSMVSEVTSGRFCEKTNAQIHADLTPVNDLKSTIMPVADDDFGMPRLGGLFPVLPKEIQSLDRQFLASDLPVDTDRWCWPNSEAMTGREIDTFTARQARFTGKGVSRAGAEAMADRLVIRDRERDDRRCCLECRNLSGYGHTSWRCGNWQRAGIAISSRDNKVPSEFAVQLQRCAGFASQVSRASSC